MYLYFSRSYIIYLSINACMCLYVNKNIHIVYFYIFCLYMFTCRHLYMYIFLYLYIIDLHSYKMSITWYIRLLSNSIIDLLKEINIDSYYKKDYIGIWVEEEKIAAFGVRLAKWVTMHGFALNIDTDLNYFNGMIPCGIFEHGITSIKEITNQKFKVEELAIIYSKYFLKHLNKEVSYETT